MSRGKPAPEPEVAHVGFTHIVILVLSPIFPDSPHKAVINPESIVNSALSSTPSKDKKH